MPPPSVQSNSSSKNGPSSSRSSRSSKEKPVDLLCRVRYSNTMPDIPFEPKFIACMMDLQRFVEYKQTSLEKTYKYDILTEPDMGVKIDLINPDTYALDPEIEIKMDPLDERLLEDETPTTSDSNRSKQHNRIVPWMRKTEYISSEFNRFGTSSDRQETKVGYNIKKRLVDTTVYRDRNSQIEAINRTFDQVHTPVTQHYAKPGVYAVQELPVLPDFDLWKYPFAQVIFDADPAPAGQQQSVQIAKMSQALIRGMMDDSGEQFVAYFLPTDETLDKRYDNDEQTNEYDYKLHREYNWTVKNKASKGYEENYLVVLRGDGAYYDELETRVRLSRRRREGQARVGNSRLIVTHRPHNDQELVAQEARLTQLQPPAVEEEEETQAAINADNEEGEEKEGDGAKEAGDEKVDGSDIASPSRKRTASNEQGDEDGDVNEEPPSKKKMSEDEASEKDSVENSDSDQASA